MASKETVLVIFERLKILDELQRMREEALQGALEGATSELERMCIEEIRDLTEDWPTATMRLLLAAYTVKLSASRCTKLLSLLKTPESAEIVVFVTDVRRESLVFWSLCIDQIDFNTSVDLAQTLSTLPPNTYLQ